MLVRLGCAVVVLLAGLPLSLVVAQAGPEVTWTQTTLTGPVRRLYTPASGVQFARTNAGLARSDDAGASWSTVTLPAARPVSGMPPGWTRSIAVDPTDHQIIYVATADGIYKTENDGASWRLTRPVDPDVPTFLMMTVSPADN